MSDLAQAFVVGCLIWVCLMLIGVRDTINRLVAVQSRAVSVQEQMLARQAVEDSIVWGIPKGEMP